jgi:cytochrome P450 PksS
VGRVLEGAVAWTPATAIDAPDIASARFKANPYPFYARLRDEAPLFPIRVSGGRRGFLVTRYDDVVAALRHDALGKDPSGGDRSARRAQIPFVTEWLGPLEKNMLDLDVPDHTRLRSLVHKAFTPRLVEQLRGRVQALTDELLDRAAQKATRGEVVDLVAEFALPLPATIIAQMLGVPPEDQRKFHRWSSDIVVVTGAVDLFRALPSVLSFLSYLRKLVAARRAEPRDDLVTALVRAEEDGDRLTRDEILAMVFLLLVAGHETTVNLISGGTLALLQDPEQLDLLRRSPELTESAMEELLRFVSPVEIATERYAKEEVALAGGRVPKGGLVLTVLGAANRDDRQFAAPDRLDVTRAPNRHVAFGQGPHYCLGAPLARLEGRIAFETLLQRFPTMRLALPPEKLRWRKGMFLRGVHELPLRLA